MTRRVGLWWIFGGVGLIGGWLTALAYGHAPSAGFERIALILPGCTAGAAALLGLLSEWLLRKDKLVAIACCIVAAGIFNGIVIGLLIGGGVLGMLIGGVFGFFHALPFFLPLMMITVAARKVGRARTGSLADAAHRRGVWIVASAVTAAGVGIVSLLLELHFDVISVLAAIGSAVAVCALLVVDWLARRRLRDRKLAWTEATACDKPRHTTLPITDFGTGDEWRVRYSPATSPYRDVDTPAELFHGQPQALLS